MADAGFIYSKHDEPHKSRGRELLQKYPELKTLFGPAPSTAFFVLALVASQVALAIFLKDTAIWKMLLVAYLVGAIINHGLFVLIHDCTHNLALKGTFKNKVLAIIASLGIGFPMAMSFRKYHLLHHRYQGDADFDADLPTVNEAKLIGYSPLKKGLWLAMFIFIEGAFRPSNLKQVKLMDKWTVANSLVVIAAVVPFIYFFGWQAYIYVLASTFFSVGLHPLGARWIQEHFMVKKDQETYSYYGILNKVSFNVGFHNEHHDLTSVPWQRLPQVKKMAPEFYETLYYHTSWTKLLMQFLFDKNLTLFSRTVREPKATKEQINYGTSESNIPSLSS